MLAKFTSQLSVGALLIAFLFLGHSAAADAAKISKTLAEDVRITPPGVIVATTAQIPKFKKGTTAVLTEYGEVLEGVLIEDIDLPYETGAAQSSVKQTYTPVPFYVYTYSTTTENNRVLSFKGGTKVIFNDKGEVIRGTVSNGSIVLNQTTRISVSDGEVSFYKNGMVETCTLGSDTYLRPVGWQKVLTENYTNDTACPGFVEFKSGKPIVLNEKGEVVKGTLNKKTQLVVEEGLITKGGMRTYEAGTAVEFDEKGFVVNAK